MWDGPFAGFDAQTDATRRVSTPGPNQHGPVLTWFSRLGRVLRYIAGVDEKVMDRLGAMRAWYASLGAVIVMVGVIAAFSMWFAVQQATSAGPVVAVVPAIVWLVFIIVMDRWIISSRASEAWQRLILLVTRGLLAILFGVVIAEPLVLKVFENQIVQEVRAERSASLDLLRSRLLECNPDPADPTADAPPADCSENGYDLGIVAALAAQQRELADLKQQATELSDTIASERNTLAELQRLAADECVGVARPDGSTTGRRGEGINCRRNTEAANAYNASVPWAEQEALLLSLQRQIADLQPVVSAGQRSFTDQRLELIEARLAHEPQPDDEIGLLKRMEVLHGLGSGNFTLVVGIWLVRLLLVAIDSSPVLMKIASGKTAYDQWVDSSLSHVVAAHEDRLRGKASDRQVAQEAADQRRRRDRDIDQRRRREQDIAAREEGYLRRDEPLD